MAKPDRKPDPDFEPDYDTPDADYEEGAQAEYDQGGDVDYDEGAQPDYDTDFVDLDAPEASQEWYLRKQK